MEYQKYTDKEIKALEKLTVREVSPAYYEKHKMLAAPVIRNRHILMFRCSRCGRYFEYMSGIEPKAYEEYQNRKYCRACWEKEQHLIHVPCRDCGRSVTLAGFRSQFSGRCRECWLKRLPSLRNKYARYRTMLEDILFERGIELEPVFTDGLDETGRPDHSPEDLHLKLLPLRDQEYALYLFRAGGGILAFPDNGINLRYLKAPEDERILEAAYVFESLLAAGSDGKDIYVLTGKGDLYSSNKNILKEELPGTCSGAEDCFPEQSAHVRLIDPITFCMGKAGEYFTEEELQGAAAEFCSHGIRAVSSYTYYDPEAKKFFKVLTDGNYYHGYDVSYPQADRSEVLEDYVRYHFSIDQFLDECEAGTIPMLSVISRLPWSKGPYTPPDGFGAGVHFV